MDEYLKMAGKKSDADATDRTITLAGPEGFKRVLLDCRDSSAEMAFAFGGETIATSSKVIYLKPGDIYEDVVSKGCFTIHYKGSGVFRYQAY